jgi:hypothetical protein
MKVGAGGLQSQVMFELDSVRRGGLLRTEHQIRTDFVPELNRNIPASERLVRLVEQLNVAAALVNYPFRFRTKRVKDRTLIHRYLEEEADEGEEVSFEELERILRHLKPENILDESI